MISNDLEKTQTSYLDAQNELLDIAIKLSENKLSPAERVKAMARQFELYDLYPDLYFD